MYGEDFQFLRPSFGSQVSVNHILSFNDEHVVVAFSDNSLALFGLPALNLLEVQPGAWLHEALGDISALYMNEYASARNFVYVGTSSGCVRILEVLPLFRQCEYMVSPADAGLTAKQMAVSDLQICPKV